MVCRKSRTVASLSDFDNGDVPVRQMEADKLVNHKETFFKLQTPGEGQWKGLVLKYISNVERDVKFSSWVVGTLPHTHTYSTDRCYLTQSGAVKYSY